jgi:hypothetical protein
MRKELTAALIVIAQSYTEISEQIINGQLEAGEARKAIRALNKTTQALIKQKRKSKLQDSDNRQLELRLGCT